MNFNFCFVFFFIFYPVAEEWVKIDVGFQMQKWIKQNNLTHIMDISCNTCDDHPSLDLFSLDHDYRPFIVVNTHTNRPLKRQRRNIDCAAGISECCREKLYISFAEIGWDDWILHPRGYDAYFCRGSCTSTATITLSGSHYNSVMRVSTVKLSLCHNSFNSLSIK